MLKTSQAQPANLTVGQKVWFSRSFFLPLAAILAVGFLAAVAFFVAWQTRPTYKIDIGERLDRPFLSNFNTREPAEDFRLNPKNQWDGTSYRWSRAESSLELPGLGAQPLTVTLRFTRSAHPTPTLQIFADGKLLATPVITQDGWVEQAFLVPVEQLPDGNLKLTLKSLAFTPKGDSRQLGLAYDWLKIEPAPDASRFVVPPLRPYLTLVAAILLFALMLGLLGLPALWLFLSSAVATGGLTYWLIADRLSLTVFLERNVLLTFGLVCVGTVVLAKFAPFLYTKLGLTVGRLESAWLAFFFWFFFVTLWGVQFHPQFESSDVGLAYRHMQTVAKGQLVLAEPLPNGQLSPYAPVFYLLLQPFMFFTGTDRLAVGNLVAFANILFTASGVFLVFYLAGVFFKKSKFSAPNLAGLIAAAFYPLNRYHYYIFSQGNHANLFGAWAFLFFLCVLVWTLDRPNFWTTRNIWLKSLPFVVLFFTLLTHYGTFLFANVFMLAFAFGWAVLGGKGSWKISLYLLGGWLVTVGLSFAVYYHNHFQIITAPFRGTTTPSEKKSFEIAGFFRALYASNRDNFSLIFVIVALGGLVLLTLVFWQFWTAKNAATPPPISRLAFVLHLSLLATGLAFAFAEIAQGLESRYQLYIIAPGVLLGGYFLAKLWRTSYAGILLTLALFGFQFLQTLLFWLERLTYYGFGGL